MITVVATFITIAYLFFVASWAYFSMFTFLSTLYANCLLATLNARIFIQNSSQHYQLSTALFDGNDGELEGVNGNNKYRFVTARMPCLWGEFRH
ncbi:hypothetical protein SERLA73DRAFT_167069 [Serpula lacrymans var. lacrymans S7.3]|uniref:Uncharacterized protein n=2 Tax=Serpula lacrymans var. lacrymans TaxID=341189 RepID=F8PSY4_SERL3|nr:uncharacterized protein SERLADRAFT_368036 [Serpula lacrymans var. lacrymans S7.9]EGO00842.1 hypothetical protein SERLA73DRAFT_167069 [Serpula lacrymans var. lacrymans S7.3]EGO26465.1 hypothetical protein SERLADRAFT_368036 [Serpula lacrymans var. lacrymans S7.9]